MSIQIIPAILSQTEEQFKQDIEKFSHSKLASLGWIHIDFMDDILVPNKSISPQVVKKYPINVKKEAHLMVAYPLKWAEKLAKAGFNRVIFHLEARDNPIQMIKTVRARRMEVGIAINMDTSLEKLEPLIKYTDEVLVMAITPGFQGQPFIPESITRIKKIKSMGWKVQIGVDSAVRDNNAKQLAQAGADRLTIGSFLIKENSDRNLEVIMKALNL